MKNPFAENCIEILNQRIEQEELSARLYEAMSLWLNDKGYTGAAKSWKKDSEGEMEHAQWAKDFLLALGVNPKLPLLTAPQHEFTGLPDIIRQTYAHEIKITEQCNALANYAYMNGNHLLYQLAAKYLTEQAEELAKSQDLIDKLQAFGESEIAMKLFDNELGR